MNGIATSRRESPAARFLVALLHCLVASPRPKAAFLRSIGGSLSRVTEPFEAVQVVACNQFGNR